MSDRSVRHPLERVEIYKAYPYFGKWFESQDLYNWYQDFTKESVFTQKDFNYYN